MNLTGFNTKYAIGVDLHSKISTIDVIDKRGRNIMHRNIQSTPEAFINAISNLGKSITVCAESTFNWYWLSNVCKSQGLQFKLGHALYIKRSRMGKHKDDDVDTEHMTSLIYNSKFPVAYEYPELMRAARDLFRRRMFFVDQRAGALIHIQNTFYQHGQIESLKSDLRRKKDRNEVLKRMPDNTTRESLHADLIFIDSLDTIIKDLESKALAIAKQHDPNSLRILQSMPGLGIYLALTILYEIHTIERFASVQNFSSYARTVKARCISSNKTVGAGEDKIGNPTLNWALTEIAIHIGTYDSVIKLWYDRLKRRKGLKCARSTMIHKIAVAIFYMLKRKEPFDVNKFLAGNNILRTDSPKGHWRTTTSKPHPLIGTQCAIHSKATKKVNKSVTSN